MSVVVLLSAVVGLIVALAVSAGLGALARWVPASARPRSRTSTVLQATLALSPALLSFLTFVAILIPGPLLTCHCTLHDLHHPHLCLYHPDLAAPLLAPALVFAAVWAASVMWGLSRAIREIAQGERWASRLRQLPRYFVDGIEVRVASSAPVGAFTVGIRRPVIVVDSVLWTRLSADERRAVVHHESAHVERRDALTLSALRITSALSPWPASQRWLRAWKVASETLCDRYAALTLGDPGLVAEALVSVERLRSATGDPRRPAPALAVAAGTDLETRVHALLALDDGAPRPVLASDLLAVSVALIGIVLLVVAWPGGSFHHVAESLLGLVRP